MDPDDLARSDPAKLRALIAGAKSLLEFLIDQIRERHELERPEGRLRFLDEVAPVLRSEPDPVRRDVYISSVAGSTGVDPALVRQRVEAAPAPSATVGRVAPAGAKTEADSVEGPEMKQTPVQERYVMALLTRYPEEIARADLIADDLVTPELRELLKFLQSGQRPSSDLPAHLAATAAALGAIAPELGDEADPGQVIEIAARRLRVQTIKDHLGEARAKLAQATGGDASALAIEVERLGGELDLAMARVERRTVLNSE